MMGGFGPGYQYRRRGRALIVVARDIQTIRICVSDIPPRWTFPTERGITAVIDLHAQNP